MRAGAGAGRVLSPGQAEGESGGAGGQARGSPRPQAEDVRPGRAQGLVLFMSPPKEPSRRRSDSTSCPHPRAWHGGEPAGAKDAPSSRICAPGGHQSPKPGQMQGLRARHRAPDFVHVVAKSRTPSLWGLPSCSEEGAAAMPGTTEAPALSGATRALQVAASPTPASTEGPAPRTAPASPASACPATEGAAARDVSPAGPTPCRPCTAAPETEVWGFGVFFGGVALGLGSVVLILSSLPPLLLPTAVQR